MTRFLKLLLLLLIIILIYSLADQYIFCPSYIFNIPQPFKGTQLYNPYKQITFSTGNLVNLHGHTHCWNGLTNGKGNGRMVKRRYDSLGYSFYTLSQYHLIDTSGIPHTKTIPVYEHGVNIKKTHQLILGSKNILWKDYIWPQTIDNKQHILELLAKDTSNLIVLNHPSIRNGYTLEDMTKLKNYNLIEGLRPNSISIKHWDAALSSGNSVFLLGNDDFHNINNDAEIGNHLTLVFTSDTISKTLLQQLRKGCSIAVSLNHANDDNLSARRRKIQRIHQLIENFSVQKDTLRIQLRERATIIWKSDFGKTIDSTFHHTSVLRFVKQSSYVRLEVITEDKIHLYFNPIFRTIAETPEDRNLIAARSIKIEQIYQTDLTNKLIIILLAFILSWKTIGPLFKKKNPNKLCKS